MARRKRASMREGPLADLFRSTVEPEDPPAPPEAPRRSEDKTSVLPSEPVEEPTRVVDEPVADEPEPVSPERPVPPVEETPDPERVHAYRVDERPVTVPEPKERLSRIFDDRTDPDPPLYGRADPSRSAPSGPPRPHDPVIRVVGVGGAGVNAVNRMVEAQIPGVEFMAINTDLQSLQQSTADVTVHLGQGVARGLGAGSDPEIGYRAAFEEQDKIKRLLKGSDMVFITAGAGGGTGTGAAPVVARLARDVGALAVGIVTRPFRFEGTRRSKQAEDGIEALGSRGRHPDRRPERAAAGGARPQHDDDRGLPGRRRRAAPGRSGHLRADHASRPHQPRLRRRAHDHARRRARAAWGSAWAPGTTAPTSPPSAPCRRPCSRRRLTAPSSILLSVTGGSDLTLLEVSEAAKVVQEAAHPDANIIFGANVDESLSRSDLGDGHRHALRRPRPPRRRLDHLRAPCGGHCSDLGAPSGRPASRHREELRVAPAGHVDRRARVPPRSLTLRGARRRV